MAKKGKEEKKTGKKSADNSGKVENEKVCAALSYLFIGIIWYFFDENMKKSEYAKFHAKQGIVLLVVDIIFGFISMMPIIGWLLAPLLYIAILILLIVGIVNAIGGKEKNLPVIGKFAENFKF